MKSGWAWVLPAALVLAGCTPTAPPTTPAPTPTFMCTPEAGGAESPCSQQDYEKMKARDAQYAEAEKVYREYIAEFEQVMRDGGAERLPPRTKSILADKELAASILAQFVDFKKSGLHLVGPGIVVQSANREPGKVSRDSVVTMRFCVDASRMTSYQGRKKSEQWGIAMETMYFRPAVGVGMQIVDGESEVAQACD